MKPSSFLSAATVLAGIIGIVIGLGDRQRIKSLGNEHGKLAAEARTLGIDDRPAGPSRDRRVRDDRGEVARRVARDTIAAVLTPLPADEGTKDADRRRLALLEPVTALDASQLKIFIVEVLAAESLDEPSRRDLAIFALHRLSSLIRGRRWISPRDLVTSLKN